MSDNLSVTSYFRVGDITKPKKKQTKLVDEREKRIQNYYWNMRRSISPIDI